MARRLPPFATLRVFEVAARTNSYVEAGRVLGLTHGAVSRQIASLEAWLGQRLFVRIGRRMVATEAARAFAAEVSRSFDRVLEAAEQCGRRVRARTLRVSAPTSFAMRWLIPRLDRFEAMRPEVEVSVSTVTTLEEELRGGYDVAIRRGSGTLPDGERPQHRTVAFLEETDVLIASPALLRRHPVATAADILAGPRLATETRPRDWADWLGAASLPHPHGPLRVFDHFFITTQAVLDGLGFGVGPVPVLAGEIRAGRLVAPLPAVAVARAPYRALVPLDADKSPSLDAFLAWLGAEGEADGVASTRLLSDSVPARTRAADRSGPVAAAPPDRAPATDRRRG